MKITAALLLSMIISGCATRRYVREQIAINNCVQVLKAIDRENRILYAAAERSGPQRSEIRQRVYDKAAYEMSLRLNKRNETTQKINEGYKGPIQTADGQKMEKPDYEY